MHRPTEVTQFNVAVVGHEEVLGLDIAVDDVVLVAVVERVGHLIGVFGGAEISGVAIK